jgi:hypothetical protein
MKHNLTIEPTQPKIILCASTIWVAAEQTVLSLQNSTSSIEHIAIDTAAHLLMNSMHITPTSPKLWIKVKKTIEISIDVMFHLLGKYGTHYALHERMHRSVEKVHFGMRHLEHMHTHNHVCQVQMISWSIVTCLIAEQVYKYNK